MMDTSAAARFDALLGQVTTLSPNHLDDWIEIQSVLNRVRDERIAVTPDELAKFLQSRGVEQDDMKELRRRIRATLE